MMWRSSILSSPLSPAVSKDPTVTCKGTRTAEPSKSFRSAGRVLSWTAWMRNLSRCMSQHERGRTIILLESLSQHFKGFDSLTSGWYEHASASSHATAWPFALLVGTSTEPSDLSAPAANVCKV